MSRLPRDEQNVISDDVLQALARGVPPVELSAQQRASMRARVMERALDVPPADTETVRGDDVPWREAFPKVWIKVLRQDRAAAIQIMLLKFEPGGRIPAHSHAKDEECLVIEGEVLVGTHRVRAGDFHLARAGGKHPDLVSERGALVMLRSELY